MEGLNYTKVGDYYIPNLVLKEQPNKPVGRYGGMRQRYLKEHRKGLYARLLLTEKLYSLNAFEWSENYAVEHSPSPEEILLLKEEQAAHERLLSLLDEAFSVVTPMQARRIRSYYLRGRDFTQIGREEHVDKSVVNRSVHRGVKYMRDYYERQKTE